MPDFYQYGVGAIVDRRNLGNPTTTSAAATSTSSNNDGHGDISKSLDVHGSPPLIIAFLAIGLFTAALIAIFGWRRVVVTRQQVARANAAGAGMGGTPKKGVEFGAKPELWDLWTRRVDGDADNEQLNWDQIMVGAFSNSVIKCVIIIQLLVAARCQNLEPAD